MLSLNRIVILYISHDDVALTYFMILLEAISIFSLYIYDAYHGIYTSLKAVTSITP